MPPVHPGEILREDFMRPMGLLINKLAIELRVPATRIGEIVHERRRITAETALRLARYFHTNAEFGLICRTSTTSKCPGVRERCPRLKIRYVRHHCRLRDSDCTGSAFSLPQQPFRSAERADELLIAE